MLSHISNDIIKLVKNREKIEPKLISGSSVMEER